nr:hypothetical protein AIIDPAOG_00059 [Gallid alphaherpesvirus 2]WOL21253.1 hypothetical protein PIKIBBIB_00061 [Gallid alphaherpesvirus 2]WOL21445.1 hypothetical protein MOAAAGMB_00053 [Gallid alphaherpesvirus 2]WOL21753.1 hypothetical protein DMEEGDKK_00067 [Gallid alphaherpesvirus 2]
MIIRILFTDSPHVSPLLHYCLTNKYISNSENTRVIKNMFNKSQLHNNEIIIEYFFVWSCINIGQS